MRFISGQLSSSLSSEKPKLDAETYEKRLKECVKAGLDDIEYNLLKEENIILACMAYLLAVDWAEEFHERSSGKKFQSPEETLNTLAELSGKDIEAVTKLYNKFSTEYIEHARPNIYRNMIDVVTALHEEFMGDPWVILKVGVFE